MVATALGGRKKVAVAPQNKRRLFAATENLPTKRTKPSAANTQQEATRATLLNQGTSSSLQSTPEDDEDIPIIRRIPRKTPGSTQLISESMITEIAVPPASEPIDAAIINPGELPLEIHSPVEDTISDDEFVNLEDTLGGPTEANLPAYSVEVNLSTAPLPASIATDTIPAEMEVPLAEFAVLEANFEAASLPRTADVAHSFSLGSDSSGLVIELDYIGDLDFNFNNLVVDSIESPGESSPELLRAKSLWNSLKECSNENICVRALEFLQAAKILKTRDAFEGTQRQYERTIQVLDGVSTDYSTAMYSKQEAASLTEELEAGNKSWQVLANQLKEQKREYDVDIGRASKLGQEITTLAARIEAKRKELEAMQRRMSDLNDEAQGYCHLKNKGKLLRATHSQVSTEKFKLLKISKKAALTRATSELADQTIQRCFSECNELKLRFA